MMKSKPKNKTGASKGQLALVAILGVILVAVLARNFKSEESAEVTAAAEPVEGVAAPADGAPAAVTAPGAAPEARNPSPFGDYAVDQNWPRAQLDEVIKFDPLADGKADEPVIPQYNAEEIDALRNAQDAIIFMTDGQTVARIGSKEYHVGDVVGGLEIRDISSAGIVLGEPN